MLKRISPSSSFRQFASGGVQRLLARVLRFILMLGTSYLMLFTGASTCKGLLDKPPTNTPRPANTNRPTKKPVHPSDTPVPIYTTSPTITLTTTSDSCICGSSPTVLGVPSCTFTPTPTSSATSTETSTNTAYPGGTTSTPLPTTTLTPTVTGSVSAGQAGPVPLSGSAQGTADASAVASWTPIRNRVIFPWRGTDFESNLNINSAGMRLILLLAALVMGGGAVFALQLMSRKQEYDLPAGGRRAAAAIAIDPIMVGAFGFPAKLSGQIPLLTYGEKVVLTKVENGIDSALHHAGRMSDLKRISERGAQEFHQLATSAPFLASSVRGMVFPA